MRYERVLVTPAKAKNWLAQNAENQRNEKRNKIPMYARDMASGRWSSDTGETIKFSENGKLIDGQNRLRAVIMADTAVQFDVAYDVPVGAMLVIDTGAARTAGDALKIAGATNRFTGGALVRWVINWNAGNYGNYRGNMGVNPTTMEIWDRYQVEPATFDSASQRAADCRQRGLGTASAVSMGFYLASKIDQDQAHRFLDDMLTGANLPEGDPVLSLRNRFIRVRADRIRIDEQLALFIRAWNARRAGETMFRVVVSNKGPLNNTNFPQPK